MFQYDLRRGPDSAFIVNSAVLVNSPDGISSRNDRSDDYQIGPDGKLYTARYSGLGLIRYPEAKGLACGYDPNYLRVDTTASIVNFPNFVDSWFANPEGCSMHPLRPFTVDTLLCQYDVADFSAPWVGRPDISVEWRIPGSEVIAQSDTTISVRFVQAGEHLVKVLWSDPVNGADSAVGIIHVHPTPVVSAGPDTTICRGESLLLGDPLNDANGDNMRFAWSPAVGLDDSTLARPTATFATRGRYVLTAVDTLTGCETVDTITVEVNPLPFVDAGADTALCSGGEVHLQANPFALDPGHTFRWEPSEGLDCDTCFAVNAQVVKTTTYRVTVTNRFGCSLSDSVRVAVLDASFDVAIADTAICEGESVELGFSPVAGLGYTWEPSTGIDRADISSPRATPGQSRTWRVTATDSMSGCSVTDSVTVEVLPRPIADAGDDMESCADGDVVLGLHIEDLTPQYLWRRVGSDSILSTSALFPLRVNMEGDYELEVIDRTTGCSARDTVHVNLAVPPVADAGEDLQFCGVETELMLGPVTYDPTLTYHWEPSIGLLDPDRARTGLGPEAGGVYVLHVTDPQTGCTAEDTVTVERSEPRSLEVSISREYRGFSGEELIIAVESGEVPPNTGIDHLEIEISYDPTIVLPDPGSVRDLLAGTLLEGWSVMSSEISGSGILRVVLENRTGARFRGTGDLLRFRSSIYLSSQPGSDLVPEVHSNGECVEYVESAGHVEIDTICGLNLRLIEFGGGRYTAPRGVPNPSGDPVTIEFGVGREGQTRLEAYDASGRRAALLLDEAMPAGNYRVEWRGVSSGVYVLRITSGGYVGEGRVVVR